MKTQAVTKSDVYSQGLKYAMNLDNQSYSVVGIGTCKDADIIIPTTHHNLPVTSIGNYAFCGCTGLTNITIPDGVTSIGDNAFYECAGLTNITIPKSVTNIGVSAFGGCTAITNINVDSKNSQYHSVDNCLIETASKTLIAGCKNSVIPDDGSVTNIGFEAFYNCAGLTNITLPNNVTSIGNFAFSGCKGLTSITIPNSVTSIGVGAFYDCTGLTSITIPNSVTSIGVGAFAFCVDLHKSGTFKATDENMCCQHFQYSLNKKYETDCAVLCKCGFHFCTNAFDLLNYYSGEIGRTVRFFEVKVDKVAEERDFDSKRVCKEITFLREIKSYAELLN